jgi:hypothetical protein
MIPLRMGFMQSSSTSSLAVFASRMRSLIVGDIRLFSGCRTLRNLADTSVREGPYETFPARTLVLAPARHGREDLMVQVVRSLLKISTLPVKAASIVHTTHWRTT